VAVRPADTGEQADHRGYRRKKARILRQADVCWLYGGLIVA
jgi:hypothetical protein